MLEAISVIAFLVMVGTWAVVQPARARLARARSQAPSSVRDRAIQGTSAD